MATQSIPELVEQFRTTANKWMSKECSLEYLRAGGLKGITDKQLKAWNKAAWKDKAATSMSVGDYIISRQDQKLKAAIDKCTGEMKALRPALKAMADELYRVARDNGIRAPMLPAWGNTPTSQLWVNSHMDILLSELAAMAGNATPATRVHVTVQNALNYIKSNPGAKGDIVATAIHKTPEHFRKSIVPKLKGLGVTNAGNGDGYFPPA